MRIASSFLTMHMSKSRNCHIMWTKVRMPGLSHQKQPHKCFKELSILVFSFKTFSTYCKRKAHLTDICDPVLHKRQCSSQRMPIWKKHANWPDNIWHQVAKGHQFAVDFSHGPECNAEEPACNYQICTPDVLPPTTFLHPLQAIPVVPPVTLQRPKTPTRRRERERVNATWFMGSIHLEWESA